MGGGGTVSVLLFEKCVVGTYYFNSYYYLYIYFVLLSMLICFKNCLAREGLGWGGGSNKKKKKELKNLSVRLVSDKGNLEHGAEFLFSFSVSESSPLVRCD